MNSKDNLVPLDFIKKKIKETKFANSIKEVGYSNLKNKKYYVILNNSKRKINFGHPDYEDSLYREYKKYPKEYIEERRRLYKIRNKSGKFGTPSFFAYHILW